MEAYYKENRECTNSADFYDKLMQLKAEQEEHIRLVEAVYLRELTGNSPVLSGPQASTPRRKRSGSKPRKGILKSSSTEDKDKVPPSSRPSPGLHLLLLAPPHGHRLHGHRGGRRHTQAQPLLYTEGQTTETGGVTIYVQQLTAHAGLCDRQLLKPHCDGLGGERRT